MVPDTIFKDRHYSSQAIIGLITANYIVFAIAVEICVSCTQINWFFWIILAGLAAYNYYIIRRNQEEFAEKRTRLIYVVSILGLGIIYYLLAFAAQHCQVTVPVK